MTIEMQYYYRKGNTLFFRNKGKNIKLECDLPKEKIDDIDKHHKLKRGHYYYVKMNTYGDVHHIYF